MKILFLSVLYGVIPGVQFTLFLLDMPFFGIFDAVNYFFSIFSYYFILNHILITLKLPFLQKRLPYDRMVKFHVVSGTLVIIGLYYHVLDKLLRGKSIDFLSWVILVLFTVLYALAVLWIEAPGVRRFRRMILIRLGRKNLAPYDGLKMLHGYAFLLLAFFSFLHIRKAGVLDSSYTFAAVYPLIHLALVLGLFFYSRLRRLWLPLFRLVENRQIHDVSILTFTPVGRKSVGYKAGQFGYLKWKGSDLSHEEHPFSFLSSPSDPQISLGIKVLGDFTQKTAQTQAGSIAWINGGFGNFIPDYAKGKVCLIGSGIGIVPMVSLIKDMARMRPEHGVLCFLAVNTREDLLVENEIKQVAKDFPSLDLRILIYTEDAILYSTEFFKEAIANPHEYNYYLCSSMPVRTIVLKALHELGVPRSQFHFEAFSY